MILSSIVHHNLGLDPNPDPDLDPNPNPVPDLARGVPPIYISLSLCYPCSSYIELYECEVRYDRKERRAG